MRDGAAERCAGVDTYGKDVHRFGRAIDGNLDEIGAFVLQAKQTVMGEIGAVRPGFEIKGGEDPEYEILGIGYYHYPLVGRFIPRYVRISELVGGEVGDEDGIAGVFGKCVAAIDGVGDFLDLGGGIVEGVNGYDAVGLVREETRCIVGIDDGTATEDLGVWGSIDGDLLVRPVVEILGSCVAPVLVPGYCASWIVWLKSVHGIHGNVQNAREEPTMAS